MKDFMTLKQLMECAHYLRSESDSFSRIAAESRQRMEAIWNMAPEARTDEDVKKAEMAEDEYKRRIEKATALGVLAEIIENKRVEIDLVTEE